MKFGLTGTDLGLIKSAFEAHPRVEKVILYGTRALGTSRMGSDANLALVGRG